MSNPGIDYGRLDQSNRNKQTGIHYGVIPIHDLNEWAIESFEDDYGDPTCPKCGSGMEEPEAIEVEEGELQPDEWPNKGGCADFACASCKMTYDSSYAFGDEPLGWTLDDGEYKAEMGGDDSDIFIVQSPYYTHAQFCSPCAPGAGYLLNPCDEGPKTYCFGPDWFDKERPCPYPVYSVKTGECLYMPLPSD